jgi:hypothetical protein
MRVIALGIALGVAAASAVARLIASALTGVGPQDPIAFVGATIDTRR